MDFGPWATKSEDAGLIVRAISFQDFQPMWSDPPTSQTDRRHAMTALCSLHLSASRGKN